MGVLKDDLEKYSNYDEVVVEIDSFLTQREKIFIAAQRQKLITLLMKKEEIELRTVRPLRGYGFSYGYSQEERKLTDSIEREVDGLIRKWSRLRNAHVRAALAFKVSKNSQENYVDLFKTLVFSMPVRMLSSWGGMDHITRKDTPAFNKLLRNNKKLITSDFLNYLWSVGQDEKFYKTFYFATLIFIEDLHRPSIDRLSSINAALKSKLIGAHNSDEAKLELEKIKILREIKHEQDMENIPDEWVEATLPSTVSDEKYDKEHVGV